MMPGGRFPDGWVQVYCGVPPVAESACEYASPTRPAGSDGVVMVSAAAFTLKLSARVADWLALSDTRTVNPKSPAAVGVPVICPPALSASPPGSEPAATDQLYGTVPPDAARVCE